MEQDERQWAEMYLEELWLEDINNLPAQAKAELEAWLDERENDEKVRRD